MEYYYRTLFHDIDMAQNVVRYVPYFIDIWNITIGPNVHVSVLCSFLNSVVHWPFLF